MHVKTAKTKEAGKRKIEKALVENDFLNGGLANPDRKNQFERLIRGTNDMMNAADIEFTDTTRVQYDKQYMGRRVLEASTEATTFTNIHEPDFDGGTITLQKLTGGYTISYEALINNIEKKAYQPRLTADFMEKASFDISDLAVNGDTGSGDPFYAKINGFYKRSDNSYIVDAEGNTIGKNVFYTGFRALPKEVRRKKSQLRWFGNSLLETDWREKYGDRATVGGDSATRGQLVSPDGIPFVTCDEIGADLAVDYTSPTYGEHTGTVYDTFVIVTGSNDVFRYDQTIDGAASGATSITATAGTYTAPELAAHLNALVVLAGDVAFFTAVDGKLRVRTTKTGANQSFQVVAIANNMYATVGMTAATYSGAAASSTGSINHGTYAFLTLPKNFKVYLLEDFRTYWKYIEKDDTYEFTTHFFMNTRIVAPTALVRVDNIRLMDY